MELLPSSTFSPDCEEPFHRVQVTLGFEPCLWLKEKTKCLLYLEWAFKTRAGQAQSLSYFSLFVVFREISVCTHFCCRPPWQCSGPPKNVVSWLMTQASPDTGLSQGGSGSFACICVKEGVIILLA